MEVFVLSTDQDAAMSTDLPSTVQDELDRAVREAREQGKPFRVSSLFEALPPLEDATPKSKSVVNITGSSINSLDQVKIKELANLSTIPPEILLLIFPHLTPVSSICLGLTCKAFYAMHRISIPRPVGLHEKDRLYQCHIVPLYQLLKNWKGSELISVHPTRDRCFFVQRGLVEAWLRKGVGMEGFLGITDWQ